MRYWIFFIAALLLAGCKSQKKAAVNHTRQTSTPQWLIQRPQSATHYIGIARVNKQTFPTTYAEEARKKALDDLSSEIEVAIEANSILYTFETSQGHTEDFVQSIKLNSNLKLEGYELVSSHEDSKEYAVYYRLNKAQYREKEEQKKQQKIEEAKNWLSQAEEAKANKDWYTELGHRLKALQSIEDYWSDAVKTQWKGSEVFLGNYCLSGLNECFGNLKIGTSVNALRMPYGIELQAQKLSIQAMAYGTSLKNFTFHIDAPNASPSQWTVRSNELGKADLSGFKYTTTGQFSLVLSPDWKAEFNCSDQLIAALRAGTKLPTEEVKISAETPRILFQMQGEKVNQLVPALQESVRSQSLLWAQDKSDADLFCTIKLSSREGGELNGLFTSFISVEVHLKNEQGIDLYYKKFNDLKGVDLSYDRAKVKAGESLKKKFQFEILPAIKKKLES